MELEVKLIGSKLSRIPGKISEYFIYKKPCVRPKITSNGNQNKTNRTSNGDSNNIFYLYKIRTMKLGAEKELEKVAKNGFDERGHVINDPRVIPYIGKPMRDSHIDDLLNLINFLKGDLAFFDGPRPMEQDAWNRYPEDIRKRGLARKPSLYPPHHAIKKSKNGQNPWETHIKFYREYLDELDNSQYPKIVKIKYLSIALSNDAMKASKKIFGWLLQP